MAKLADSADSADSANSAFAAEFRAIQRNFIRGLPRRLEELQHAADDKQRHIALHRLAGAAGGYGFPHLGELARGAMQAMESDSKPVVDAALAQLALAIDAIVQTAND